MANVYLFGYLEDDYLGRLMMASEELTVGELAEQLSAWSYKRGAPIAVTNEAGMHWTCSHRFTLLGLATATSLRYGAVPDPAEMWLDPRWRP